MSQETRELQAAILEAAELGRITWAELMRIIKRLGYEKGITGPPSTNGHTEDR